MPDGAGKRDATRSVVPRDLSVCRRRKRRYGVPVIIKDVPDPFTGDLDGREIHLDYANDMESAVFIIAHRFGHTVQWNWSDYTRRICATPKIAQPQAEDNVKPGMGH